MLEERIVFVTKLVHQLQSCEFHYQGKNSYSEKAVQFFEKNDISVVVNFFQASPKPDGKTSKIGIAEESITIERSAKLDESNGVRYVDSDDDEPNNDESDDKLGKSDVIEGVSQGRGANCFRNKTCTPASELRISLSRKEQLFGKGGTIL